MDDEVRYDWINCQCGHPVHSVRLCVEKDQDPPVLRFEVFLPPVGFWQRLKIAFNYLFKREDSIIEIYLEGRDIITLFERLSFTALVDKIKRYKQAKRNLRNLK